MPELQLDYGLTYRFPPGQPVQVEEHWERPIRTRLQTHLRTHAAALRRSAEQRSRGEPG
jgi:hypothetical protein